MYKKSEKSRPLDLFSNVLVNLTPKGADLLQRSGSWHNVFYTEVIAPFPEDIFSVLYSSQMGRPNTSIRLLVGMIILKEGQGWTDEQLFEAMHFNIQFRWALGLRNLDDEATGRSTYYDFKKALQAYQEEHEVDLLEEAFEKLTIKQVKKYNINGQDFRMDSKLFNSKIATSNLVRLLSETLQLFLRDLCEEQALSINEVHHELVGQLTQHSSDGIAYRMTNEQKDDFIIGCGKLLLHLTDMFKEDSSKHYPLLTRLLEEQYQVINEFTKPTTDANHTDTSSSSSSSSSSENDEDCQIELPMIELKNRKDIKGSTLQSPHDPTAAYRKKENGGSIQEIRGYSTNIGETCHSDNHFNLITTVTTAPVTFQDNDYVESSIEQSERIAGTIENSWMDGAYSSASNRNWLLGESINAYFPALAGYEGFHHFEWRDKQGQPDEKELVITDLRDGKEYIAHLCKNGNHRIVHEHNCKDGRKRYRYFKPQELENYFLRRTIEELPKEILDRRANVEATIAQVFCKMGKKSRYRGLLSNHIMVVARCIWVNCQRIAQHETQLLKNELFYGFFYLWSVIINTRSILTYFKEEKLFRIFSLKSPHFIRFCQ